MNDGTSIPLSLGRPLQEFKRSKQSIRKLIFISLFSAGIAAVIFYGAWFGGGIHLGGRIALSILGCFLLLPAVAGVYMLISRSGSSVSLYQNGMIYRRRGKEFIARWDEIVSYLESTACRITKKDGEVFDFGDNVEGFEEVGDRIRQETLQRLLPQVQATIRNGASVSFPGLKADGKTLLSGALNKTLLGKAGFTVDARGITCEGKSIAWPEVMDFGVAQGQGRQAIFPFFYVRDANVSLEMNYSALPNAHVLLALCKEMAKNAQVEE